MNYRVWILSIVGIVVSGCATQGVSTTNYTNPQLVKINNEKVVPKTQSDVWDMLVKQLSKSFYVINNIDKASWIINISFSSNSPEEYIDCGRTTRTYTRGEEREVNNYDTAGSFDFKLAVPSFAYYVDIRRKTFLEGRSNIYLEPDEKDQNTTIITVNTRYIWTLKVGGNVIAEDAKDYILWSLRVIDILEKTSTIVFNTNQTGQDDSVKCVSKGKLEKEILDMVRGNSK